MTKLAAEALGSALLLAVIVGSGIAAERMAGGSEALALLANSIATGSGLCVLILILGPVSGAHLNPAVTLAFALQGELKWPVALGYCGAQVGGALVGVVLAHLMFELSPFAVSATERSGTGQLVAEGVATFGLLLTILGTRRVNPSATPFAVGLYIVSAFWFTSSTSFANPAVTIGRVFTDTFTGIAPSGTFAYIAAQFAGGVSAMALSGLLWPSGTARAPAPEMPRELASRVP